MSLPFDPAEFVKRFPDEISCLRFIENKRWPEGPVSPFTGGRAYELKTRPGVFKCSESRQQFSVKRGLIFEESHIPVRKWFFLVFILTKLKTALEPRKLAKLLGVTPKTAQFMFGKLHEVLGSTAFERSAAGVLQTASE